MIRGPPRQGYDKFKPFKLVRVNWLDCGHGLNRSGIGVIPNGTVVVFVGVRSKSGYH